MRKSGGASASNENSRISADAATRNVDGGSVWLGLMPLGWARAGRVVVPLRVRLPDSTMIGAWRPPWWQRVIFPAVGMAMMLAAFWPFEGEPYEPLWLLAAVGAGLVWYALRPKLILFQDALYIRGHILSRVIPIQEIAKVEGGYGGLSIWWGEGRMSEAPAIGEQTNIEGLPGSDGRRHDIKNLILDTRDKYLQTHHLQALPDPYEQAEQHRQEFLQRGWVEHNPPLRDTRDQHRAE